MSVRWNVGSGNWNNASNWSPNKIPDINDDVIIPRSNSPFTVTINTAATAKSLVINSQNATHASTLTLTGGGSLTTSGSITLDSTALLDGAGTINAGDGISGGGTLAAGTSTTGGVLDVFGSITGVQLAIGTAAATTLRIEGTAAVSSAIAIDDGNQTLQINSHGALTISAPQSVTNGTIDLEGGSLTISDPSGLTLGSGSLTGHGTVTGIVNGQVHGTGGTITASAGTLEFKSAVDGVASTGATNFIIGPSATLKFDGTVGAGSSEAPHISFSSSIGVLDISNFTDEMASFHGVVDGFQAGDQVKLAVYSAGTESYTTSYSNGQTTLTITQGTTPVGAIVLDGDYRNAHFNINEWGALDTITTDAACFMAGTMVRTPNGEVAVETLKRGDLVLASDGQVKPVSWLGVQTISARFADKMRVWPIRIKADALGDNVPSRDLLLSPDHAVLVDGALIQAGSLVNGTSIVREANVPEVFTYYHVEVDDHSLIVAENTPSETFVDNVDRLNFDNWAEHQALYPDGKPIVELPYPRAKSLRQVPVNMRMRLAARAQALSGRISIAC